MSKIGARNIMSEINDKDGIDDRDGMTDEVRVYDARPLTARASIVFASMIVVGSLGGLGAGGTFAYAIDALWGFHAELSMAILVAISCIAGVALVQRRNSAMRSGDPRRALVALFIFSVLGLLFGTLGAAFIETLGNSTL